MNVRYVTIGDLPELERLHNAYYSEFEFPNFNKFLSSFIIEDNDGKTIMAGGVEPVGEAVLITNQELSRIKIGKALVEAQRLSMCACRDVGIRDLYAFVKNDEYAEHLIQHGFTDCDRALSIRVK